MLIVPHLILMKDSKILLSRRSSTNKIWHSHWHCVTGSIEHGESPKEAIIREAEEEVGLKLKDVSLGTTVFLIEKDYFDPLKKFYGLELFFVCHLDDGQEPRNLEPLKQDSLGWFDPDKLPEPMIPGVRFGINSYFNHQKYVEFRNA
ncbi:MAG: NUDIX domain-containing protein [Alphaproteobacteria bacterium]|nr:NUDIX domain-containing protein [Alphaproteobacteria bacterium]